ncbi:MAG: hypothetical protein QOG91_356 [Candidatus Parcubacteria bacterium]|jgi:hypothetical protein|nr:hypothetical protein [Candidatus Parcubacteria bacterium]
MKILYRWDGPEEQLGAGFTAVSFEIQTLKDEPSKSKKATGTLLICDYSLGGALGDQTWEAFGTESPLVWAWLVKPVGLVWHVEGTGGHSCILSERVSTAIDSFIAPKLCLYMGLRQSGKADDTVIDAPPEYRGPFDEYAGPCVCGDLRASNFRKAFPWQKLTNNSRFPEHCFKCSCGRLWWCHDPPHNRWTPVGDPLAWAMLLKYNGVAVRVIVGHPEKPELYLLQTIRNLGLIPID